MKIIESIQQRKQLVMPLVVLALSGAVAWWFLASAPKASRGEPETVVRPVSVVTAEQTDVEIRISGLGLVVASQQVTLYPEVDGQIKTVANPLVPGMSVTENQTLVEIDSTDYRLLVAQQEAAVTQAKSELALERGQQIIARKEYQLTGIELPPEEEALVLREPQLAAAEAAVQQARTGLEQARLDLQRTQVVAPFNGQIVLSHIDPGSQVNSGTALLELVSTDAFQMELELPVEQLQWLEFPSDDSVGSQVVITSPDWNGEHREGRVLSASPQLSESSRLAKVVINIDDPLALFEANSGKPPVLINDMLQVEIVGKTVPRAISIADELIHNGNELWVLDPQDQLEIRTINPLFRDADRAVITEGVQAGERVIASPVTAPVEGLPLRAVNPESGEN